jgi:hypothetical protein
MYHVKEICKDCGSTGTGVYDRPTEPNPNFLCPKCYRKREGIPDIGGFSINFPIKKKR